MKLAVVGATGGIGQQIVKLALAQGHTLTAIVRTPSKVTTTHENLQIIQGDVTEPSSLECAMTGQDAVLVVLSVGNNNHQEPTTLYSEGTRNILQAMKNQGVRRYMGVSASGFVNDPRDPFFVKYLFKPMLQSILKNPYDDLQRMEAHVMATTDIDWTLVRPARLVDGECTGTYRTSINSLVPGGSSIARADVAHFLLKHVKDECVIGATVGIAY